MKSKDYVMSEIYANLPLANSKNNEDSGLSDIALARKTLRAIASQPNKKGASTGVNAALGLMKLAQLEADTPNLDGDDKEVSIKEELAELKEKSPADLAREYKELLESI